MNKQVSPVGTEQTTPDAIVLRFLEALQQQDHDAIAELLSVDLHYTNVSLPTIRGGRLVSKIFKLALRKGTGFQVKNHNIAVNGNVVLTERTDVIIVGPLHVGLWVCGTFEVLDEKIVVWRDYFDWLNVGKGVVKGLAGIVLPGLRVTV